MPALRIFRKGVQFNFTKRKGSGSGVETWFGFRIQGLGFRSSALGFRVEPSSLSPKTVGGLELQEANCLKAEPDIP